MRSIILGAVVVALGMLLWETAGRKIVAAVSK
jgi:hypothetical protein